MSKTTYTTVATKAELEEILAPSKQYTEAAYQEVIDSLGKSAKKTLGYTRLEASFPGVKPQHVAFMLKRLLGDRKDVKVTISAVHGVCAIKKAA